MNRPKITVNCAASIDGKISTSSRVRVGISGKMDKKRVTRLRKGHSAIAVGIGTVLSDDPALSVDDRKADRKLTRVVFDSNGRTPPSARLLRSGERTIIFTTEECRKRIRGARMLRCGKKKVDLRRAMQLLHEEGIDSVLVEGGGEIIFDLARLDLIDRMSVFTAPVLIGGRDAPTIADGQGFASANRFRRFELISVRAIDGGVLSLYRRAAGGQSKR